LALQTQDKDTKKTGGEYTVSYYKGSWKNQKIKSRNQGKRACLKTDQKDSESPLGRKERKSLTLGGNLRKGLTKNEGAEKRILHWIQDKPKERCQEK